MDPSIFMHFMLTDDCNTLLAVRQGNDGSLELMTTPVTILQNNSDDSIQLLKTNQTNDIFLNQIKLTNILSNNNQQSNSTSIEVIDLNSQDFQINTNKDCQLEVLSNSLYKNSQCNFVSIQDSTEGIPPEKKQTVERLEATTVSKDICVNLKKNSPTPKKYARKSLGRPKKNNKTSNEEVSWFKCDVCGQEFKKQYLLQKHMHEHAQDKPHNCPKCPASFNIPTNFTLHMATHNIGEPKCPECGRKFARIASLKSHMLIHEIDENLYCTECDDIFGTKSQLDAHSKLHSEKWSADDYRKCKLCRKQFTQPLLYRQHLRDHYKLQTKTTKQTKRGIRHRTVYKCRICLKAFEKPSQLARHIRVHTGEKPYKCNLCNRSFTQKGSVRIHMWQHNGIRPYNCSFCHAKFSQKGNLNAHILRVHNIQEGSPMYRCSQCPCIFKKLGSLNGHMKRAHNDKTRDVDEDPDKEEEEPPEEETRPQPERLDLLEQTEEGVEVVRVEPEDEASELPKNFQDGFVVTDDSEQTAVVTLLDKMSNDAKGKYIKIKQRFVNNSRLYECSYCKKSFKKPSDLMRHLRIHTREKPYKCKICSRSFTLKSTMLSHEKTHKNTRKFSCNSCTMFFSSEKELLLHEKIHSKGHKCGLCGKKFMAFDQLKAHSALHQSGRNEQDGEGNPNRRKSQYTSEVQSLAPKVVLKEPLVLTEASNGLLHAQPKFRNEVGHGKGRPHKCPACPAAFMKLSHLKQHHRKHTGERPYVCALCDRKFTTNSALKAHRRIHDLLKPYKCYVCNRNFSTSSSMKRHHITHSNKRPYMCPYCNKTFKTTVNCRKHMKVHKQEIALQQLESQKKQQYSSSTSNNMEITMTQQDNISNQEVTFQPITNNLTQNLNEQLETIMKNKDTDFMTIAPSSQNINMPTQNMSLVDNSNVGATQALHADETGTITLPNYSGNQSLTPESIREIEETLNQQLFSIGMNLALNNTVRQIEEHNNTSLENRDQPILSIIYDNGKNMESSISTAINTNVFSAQYDTFDINQITLQEDNDMDMGITQSNATNMASILPQSIQEHKHYSPQLLDQDFQDNVVLKQNYLSKDIEVFNEASIVDAEKERSYDENNEHFITEHSYQCHICNAQQFSADRLKEHLKTHQDNKEFQCTHCFSKFYTSGGLSKHLKVHETEETHKCYECNEEFSTTLQLRKHIKDHVKLELQLKSLTNQDDIHMNIESRLDDESVDKKFNKCKYCPKIFRKPSDLIRHVRTHTGERPYQCNFCDRSFAVKYTLDSHLKIHGEEKSFYCHVCNSMFATKDSLKVHMRLHTGVKSFKCSLCEMKFRTSSHRKAHFASHAQDPNPSSSAPSQSEVQQEATLVAANYDKLEEPKDEQIVRIVHTAPVIQPILPQPTDEQVIDDNPGLNALTADPMTFSADCTASSDSTGFLALNENNQLVANLQFLLANGLVTIQTEDPALTSQLPLSSSSGVQNDFLASSVVQKVQDQATDLQVIFAADMPDADVPPINNESDFELNNSMVLHMGVGSMDSTVSDKNEESSLKQTKPPSNAARRQCDICGKAFAKPCQLERHKRIHTGERPFKCDFCGKSFAQKSTLQMHQKRHTGDRPYCCPQCQRSFTQSGNLQTHLKRKHKVDPAETKRLSKTQQFVNYDPKLLQQSIEDPRVLNLDDISIVELFK